MIDEDAMLKKYRPAFFEFYDMGMEARRLKNMRSVNGTTFLVDSTLSQWHDEATNLDLKEYEKVLPNTQYTTDSSIVYVLKMEYEFRIWLTVSFSMIVNTYHNIVS